MTPQVKEFVEQYKKKLTGKVLEVGSYNVNGSVREIVDVTVGVDIRDGKGVDLVCSVEDLPKYFKPGHFDACVSTETLEHVENWKAFVTITWDMVKQGGWLVMTMAHQNKGRHDYPNDFWRFDLVQLTRIYPQIDFCGPIGRAGRPVSIGWAVQKRGELGDLNFSPYTV